MSTLVHSVEGDGTLPAAFGVMEAFHRAVQRLMTEHGSNQRSGPCRFTSGIYVPSETAFIDDDDFIYDATLKISGDCGGKQHAYAQCLCEVLNAAIAVAEEGKS